MVLVIVGCALVLFIVVGVFELSNSLSYSVVVFEVLAVCAVAVPLGVSVSAGIVVSVDALANVEMNKRMLVERRRCSDKTFFIKITQKYSYVKFTLAFNLLKKS